MAYKTVKDTFEVVYEEKKSKFIANVINVETEIEAIGFINSIKTKYWDATHNVYAYSIIEQGIKKQKFSDDKEPSGTAGLPVFDIIRKRELDDVCIVVTRYFGGVLLGASGLVRAYSKSAALVLENAGIVEKVLCVNVKVIIEYTYFEQFRNYVLANNYKIDNIVYGQDVEIICYIPKNSWKSFYDYVLDITNANLLIEYGEEIFVKY